ncbi:MFS transporter [Mycolicibacterium hodleri]|uniref:MFS transporter n=1 Tax=Mycolicibacterium hodleri TaxID=49897 RepID=A0A502E845_9MYCO|nr:MFS transporter [Mycolicibacterium hodleri]TPG33783.1 MFS transporter [Mycolicibacterium hodleri]
MRQQAQVTGLAAIMTTVAMSLGSAVAVGDLRILAANISLVRNGLQFSPGTTIFVSSLATLTLAASVLGAGVLGDKYGMKRMFVAGACSAVVFGLIGAAAPNVAVLMIARACIGVAFAFLTGLSLAIMNAVFPSERRAAAIAWYLAAVYAFGVVPATVGSLLAEHIGWRSGFLVTPVLAILVLVITLRYVPETRRSHRRTDIPGLLLVATALIGVTYGISVLQNGMNLAAVVPILTGVLAAAAFIWWELRCDDPALDLRIFRSPRFNAVVTAGAANNLVQGGSMIMVTFYLILIRDQSTWAFALLLIPATLLSALAALGAGRAAARFGNCAVVVAGLSVLAVSLLVRLSFRIDTPILVVGAVIALTTVGGAIVQTPQATVMMSSAPTNLGGVVSAVKASVGGTFYGLGSALFSMFGILFFIRDAEPKLAGTGISARQAGDILGATGDATGGATLDPERTAWVISEATSSMLNSAYALNLIMTVIPLAAISVVLLLFRRDRDAPPLSGRP